MTRLFSAEGQESQVWLSTKGKFLSSLIYLVHETSSCVLSSLGSLKSWNTHGRPWCTMAWVNSTLGSDAAAFMNEPPTWWRVALYLKPCIFSACPQDSVSVHRPGFYASRFLKFMSTRVFRKTQRESAGWYSLHMGSLHKWTKGTCTCLDKNIFLVVYCWGFVCTWLGHWKHGNEELVWWWLEPGSSLGI